MERSLRRALIVSHVCHYMYDQKLYAYGPYVREIEVWADLFPQVFIAAPCREEEPPGDAIPFTRPNISILPQKERGGSTISAKFFLGLSLPNMVWDLCRAMRGVDAIHVRCPGNLGLLGATIAPLFSRYLVAKYAGQWNGYPGEPWSVRLQRAILKSRWWRGPVTVYGQWPNQPSNIIPFFTSVMDSNQVAKASQAANNRKIQNPVNLLYVGRLSREKHVHIILSALHSLKADGVLFHCSVVGDGSHRKALEKQTEELGLEEIVKFSGPVSFERVLEFYEQANILILVSESEGWPKAIAEGMSFGLICIGSDRGLIPQMLHDGRGIIVPPGDVEALSKAIRQIVMAPQEYEEMGRRASAWAQQYSLELLRESIKELLEQHWGTPI